MTYMYKKEGQEVVMKVRTGVSGFVLAAIFSATSIAVSAAETVVTWTGAEDNRWMNANNWLDGKMPDGINSRAVFDPGEGKTLYIDMQGRGWGGVSTWPHVYEFRSGKTYFSTYIRYTGSGESNPGEFIVAEGALAVVSNEIFTAHGSACMKKSGKGELRCVGKFGHNAAIPKVTVEGGLFLFQQKDSYVFGNNKTTRVTVNSGATFHTSGGSTTLGSGNLVVHIEKGGLFKAYCGGYSYPNKIDHLEGEGTVEGVDKYALKIMGTTAGDAFSGNITGDVHLEIVPSENPVLIGGVDTLSKLTEFVPAPNLRFLPSSEPYVVANTRIEHPGEYALDTEGRPVVLREGSKIQVACDGGVLAVEKWVTPRYYGLYWRETDCGITIEDGLYCATPSVNTYGEKQRKNPLPDGMIMSVAYSGSSITMKGGALWLYGRSSECYMPKTFDLFGGDLAFVGSHDRNISKDATPESPAVLNMRGGRVLASMRDDLIYGSQLFPDTNAFRVVVHDKPAVIKAVNHYANGGPSRTISISRPFESGVAEGMDGGLVLEGAPVFRFRYPVLLNGSFTAMDGEVMLDESADTVSTPAFFGTGDVNLGNVKFLFPENTSVSKTMKFAVDEEAAFRVKGAAQITFKSNSGNAAQNIEVCGGFERMRGGVLFLFEPGCAEGLASSFKVSGGLPVNAAGLTEAPVLFYDTDVNRHLFASCGDDGSVVPLTDVATGFEDSSGKAVVLGRSTTLAAGEEKSVAALLVNNVKLTLEAGSKLNVGLGDDPALVVFDRVYLKGSMPSGGGVLDFGAREGVFVIGKRDSSWDPLTVPYTIAGSGGVTFASSSEKAYKHLKLTGSNTYTGPTTINSICVEPATDTAFGPGVVHVGGGERAGGRVYFGTPVTLANDFRVSGWGINNGIYYQDGGAFTFAADTTLTGSVTLEGDTRMTADASARGVISGSVGGEGMLSVYAGNGTIVLAGDNSWSGGAEVVSGTLAVKRTGSLGSGSVVLDGGTLAFENDSAMTLTNGVSGIGTVALRGSAPVDFGDGLRDLDASLDLCGTKQTFTELPPFTSITNSSSRKATIALAGGLGTVAWDGRTLGGRISLDIGEGTELDLGGASLDVYRLERGAIGKVVNGTVSERNPIIGMWLIVR